jgi:hypothetical protein
VALTLKPRQHRTWQWLDSKKQSPGLLVDQAVPGRIFMLSIINQMA